MSMNLETNAARRPSVTQLMPGHEGGTLERRTRRHLLTCAGLIEATLRANLRRRFGTTLPCLDLMSELSRAPNGLTMGELSKSLSVSNAKVTMVVERLVQEGFVVREASTTDRRSLYARLTDEGRRATQTMLGEFDWWLANLFSGLFPSELGLLSDALASLKSSLAGKFAAPNDGPASAESSSTLNAGADGATDCGWV